MNYSNIEIAVLLTCHNRKDKTVRCIQSLLSANKAFNSMSNGTLEMTIYLTDDGCTDGTVDAVRELVDFHKLIIIQADGNAFWAGGMRLAWDTAVNSGKSFDFYFLLNDDTILLENVFTQLMKTDEYSICNYGKQGVYTAFVSEPDAPQKITYGAKIYVNSWIKGAVDLLPSGVPQLCNMPNANILLVSKSVVDRIGILDGIYTHGAADWDYGMRARSADFPVLTTSCVCGICEFDHDKGSEEEVKVLAMTTKERKLFILRPNYFYSDCLKFSYIYQRPKYFFFRVIYYFFVYAPHIYYFIYKKRGH